jgi:hypothetical protein
MSVVLSYKLDEENKQRFIKATSEEARSAVEKMLNNTVHISFKTFITNVKNSFKRVLGLANASRPIFIYIDTDQGEYYMYKSNYWLCTYLQRYFAEVALILISSLDDDRIIQNDLVLLLDDCIYSGEQMSRSVSKLSNNYHKVVQLILFVPYMSEKGLESVRSAYRHNKNLSYTVFSTIKHSIIHPLEKFLNKSEAATIFKYYSTMDNPVNTSVELQKYAVYFDHKVGDNASSFPLFYSGFVPNQKNKKFLNKISPTLYKLQVAENNYKKHMNASTEANYLYLLSSIYRSRGEMDLFPLLQNCKNDIKVPDFFSSSCPKPPYKNDYQQYMQLAQNIPKRYKSFTMPKTTAGKAKCKKKQ